MAAKLTTNIPATCIEDTPFISAAWIEAMPLMPEALEIEQVDDCYFVKRFPPCIEIDDELLVPDLRVTNPVIFLVKEDASLFGFEFENGKAYYRRSVNNPYKCTTTYLLTCVEDFYTI